MKSRSILSDRRDCASTNVYQCIDCSNLYQLHRVIPTDKTNKRGHKRDVSQAQFRAYSIYLWILCKELLLFDESLQDLRYCFGTPLSTCLYRGISVCLLHFLSFWFSVHSLYCTRQLLIYFFESVSKEAAILQTFCVFIIISCVVYT